MARVVDVYKVGSIKLLDQITAILVVEKVSASDSLAVQTNTDNYCLTRLLGQARGHCSEQGQTMKFY